MATVKNITKRLLTHHLPFTDEIGTLKTKKVLFIPGEKTEISEKDLAELKKQKGFKFQKDNHWVIVEEVTDAVEISDSAIELAEEQGVDLGNVEPNSKGKITVTEVKKYISSLGSDDDNDDEDI